MIILKPVFELDADNQSLSIKLKVIGIKEVAHLFHRVYQLQPRKAYFRK